MVRVHPVLIVIVVAMLGVGRPVAAQTADTEAQVRALEARVQQLERDLASARAATPTPTGSTPTASASEKATHDSATSAAPSGTDASAAGAGAADDGAPTVQALSDRLDELDQQIRIVARQAEIDREAAGEKSKTTPVVTAGREGFVLKSPDSSFILRIRGYAQTDGRFYPSGGDDQPAPDTFLLRRVRPTVEGTLFKNVDFRIMPDFGGGTTVLQDAYVDLRFTPAFKIRAGKFKGPIGLERLASATDLFFIERALPTSLVPNRDVGIVVFGDVLRNTLNYTFGIQNGVADGASTDSDDRDAKDIVGRVFLQPLSQGKSDRLKGLGFGIAGSSGTQRGSLTAPNLPTYRTSGQVVFARFRNDTTPEGTTVADGNHWRVSPQGYYFSGPFGALAEYVFSSQKVRRLTDTAALGTSAWQLAASWVLTGEDSSFRGVSPRAVFDPSKHTYGAVELTARYNELHIDQDAFPVFANPTSAARNARAWGIGTNWYLNRAVKISVDFEQTRFEAGAAAGDRSTERNILTRFQVGY